MFRNNIIQIENIDCFNMKKFLVVLFACLGVGFAQAQNSMPTMGTTTITTYDPCLKIGDFYQGGIVGYLLLPTDAGYDPAKQHGLIVASASYVVSLPWSLTQVTAIGGTTTDLGAGQANTNLIIANQGRNGNNYAARYCDELEIGMYKNWYLPSQYEFNLIFPNQSLVGGFDSNFYWTSSEFSAEAAWEVIFGSGGSRINTYDLKNSSTLVRPVSSF